jgi:HK97 gp10 family phage protein
MNVKINREDLARLNQKLEGLKRVAKDQLSTQLTKTAADVIDLSTDRVPVDTGKLKQSGYFGAKGKGKVEVGYNKAYAPYQEFGTGRYINTKEAKMLGFSASDIKRLFEGKGVRQVDIKPQPFFFPSVRIAFKKLLDRLDNEIKQNL